MRQGEASERLGICVRQVKRGSRIEDRGRRCTLIVFIDDATSRLMALRFAEAETTEAYMRTLRGYLDQHGRPVAIYSDKHSIFRVNQKIAKAI